MYCGYCGKMLPMGAAQCPGCNAFVPGYSEILADTYDDDDARTDVLTADMANEMASGVTEVAPEPDTSVLMDDKDATGKLKKAQGGNVPPRAMGQAPANQPQANVAPTFEAPKPKKVKKEKAEKKPVAKKTMGVLIALAVVFVVLVGAVALLVPKYLNYKKAETAFADGDIEMAVEYYAKAKPLFESKDMAEGGAYKSYAESLQQAGKYEEAITYYEKAQAANQTGLDGSIRECYKGYADTLYAAGKYEEALEYYVAAGSSYCDDDDESKCYYQLGVALYAAGDYEAAIEKFNNALEYEDALEKVAECYSALGDAYVAEGTKEGYENAAWAYSMAGDTDKQNASLVSQAEAYMAAGDYQACIDAYIQVEDSYKDCTAELDEAYIALGDECRANKEYLASLEAYESVSDAIDVSKKIVRAKIGYIQHNKSTEDSTTMEFLCDLLEIGDSEAADYFVEITGWTVTTFVNGKVDSLTEQKDIVNAEHTVYAHAIFEGSGSLNLTGYVVCSNGYTTDTESFENITSGSDITVKVPLNSAASGDTATLYLYDASTGNIFMKYTFTFK